ncbi:hypothetical protein JXI42_04465 [bacterium]|nr:hypothetical protein [bacterium]
MCYILNSTNNFASLEDAVDIYKELFIIERCFKELKPVLKISSVYHRDSNRIKGHVYASFLSLVVDFTLLKRFKELEIDDVYEEFKTSLKELEVEWIAVKDKEVLLRDEPNRSQRKLFKSFSIKVPPAVLSIR